MAVVLALTAIFPIEPSTASAQDTFEITRTSGGSIRTPLSSKIVLNEKSSLSREWIAVKMTGFPAKLVGTPGVATKYVPGEGYSRGAYEYFTSFTLDVSEPIAAIEIRFIAFNVWGERMKSLVLTQISDLDAGTHPLSAEWNLYSENEAEEYYASIAYIARVRTKDNRVIVMDTSKVVEEARKFYVKFTESDLDPEKTPKAGK